MDIRGREPLHKYTSQTNTKTTPDCTGLETDESQLSNSDCIKDSEVTNNSPNVSNSRRRFERRSTCAARNESPVGLESSKVTNNRTKSPNSPKSSLNYPRLGTTRAESAIREDSSERSPKEIVSKSDSSSCLWIGTIGAVIIVLISVCQWNVSSKEEPIVLGSSVKMCSYSELTDKYKHESDYLWKHLKSGIEDILNDRSISPAVYLFVHSGGKMAKDLIKDIAKTSSTCFDSSMKPVEIESVDFTSEDAASDYGVVIEKYKQKIKEGNVILIANLNEIPPEAARALHSICDTFNPIVPKVMIFLSLVAENKGERAIDTAEEALRELWQSNIIPSALDPLITRVTDEVILLQSK